MSVQPAYSAILRKAARIDNKNIDFNNQETSDQQVDDLEQDRMQLCLKDKKHNGSLESMSLIEQQAENKNENKLTRNYYKQNNQSSSQEQQEPPKIKGKVFCKNDLKIEIQVRAKAIESMVQILQKLTDFDSRVLMTAIQIFDKFANTKKFRELQRSDPNNLITLMSICSLQLSSQYIEDEPITPKAIVDSEFNHDNFKVEDILELNEIIYNQEFFTFEVLELHEQCDQILSILKNQACNQVQVRKSTEKTYFDQQSQYVSQLCVVCHIYKFKFKEYLMYDLERAIILLSLLYLEKNYHKLQVKGQSSCSNGSFYNQLKANFQQLGGDKANADDSAEISQLIKIQSNIFSQFYMADQNQNTNISLIIQELEKIQNPQ
ncbi:UNKNOWN [Stylonychia lemnae]|uniref:Cyclin N-terminal domain-containing protein n=1 Tax=Stylonychia lemnae TaxID=5949 RepID=A0A078AF70_STYLE|nr:UNKNOWN [Stylonychia lemnae]|eukprot:CDW80879.1 UNKNOWN [Stylonychia lemnae]